GICVLSQVQLVQSGPGAVKVEDTLTVTCAVSGVSITDNSYVWAWIRQLLGKGLEWVGDIYPYRGDIAYTPSLQSQATLSVDTTKNQLFSLQLHLLTAADTAAYYCARDTQCDYYGFDYWGQGTMVTVTSATPAAPSLYPLLPSCGTSSSQDSVAMGCLAKDFLPDSLTFSWKDSKNASITDGTKNFPSVLTTTGTYSATTQLSVPASKVPGTFYCSATHPNGNKVTAPIELPPSPAVLRISVLLIPPTFADLYIRKSALLTCRVINMQTTEGLNITWTKHDGKGLATSVSERTVQSNGRYSVDATASVCADEWERGDSYNCLVSHPDLIFPIKNTFTKKPGSHAPSVYVFPPPAEQLALREAATVTCLVKGFNPPDLFVKWLSNGEEVTASKYVTIKPIQESSQSQLYFTYSTLNINEQEWNAGNSYTCLVGHEKLPLQVTQKTVDKSTGKPTLVNVSLVLSDTVNTCY
uniref:Immunoglobulin heavy constant mu n=1 Tax=Pelusios castaneus TaxID=367368 RepID=A0A8C8RQU6_9SAUR